MNPKQLAALLALVSITAVLLTPQTTASQSQFDLWKAKHGISYSSTQENTYREQVFMSNLAKIQAHNSQQYRTYDQAINQFTGMTQEEFVQTYLGYIHKQTQEDYIDMNEDVSVGDVNWVDQGAVTDVKDQGQCGSCWAFSATGGLQGLSKLAFGQLQSFSEQQLLDCAYLTSGNLGCNGGQMANAFRYTSKHGIVHEDDYKYEAKKGKCRITSGPFKISGFVQVKTCSDLTNALMARPVSVAVDATNWATYGSGIFNNCEQKLNHGVLLVGMTDGYWLVKNSWNTSWGLQGYIKLARGNTCGICNTASYPVK